MRAMKGMKPMKPMKGIKGMKGMKGHEAHESRESHEGFDSCQSKPFFKLTVPFCSAMLLMSWACHFARFAVIRDN